MCSETSSPRLSFSRDAPMREEEEEEETRRRDTSLVDCEDFEFSFTTSLSLSQSSADQLFSHGIIVPTQPTETIPNASSSSSSSKSNLSISNKNSSDEDQQAKTTPQSKTSSFWGGFKRSASLNCEKSKKSGLLCSLTPILSRSNSTGSVPKRTSSSSQKQPLISTPRSSSSSSLKPPLKKKGYYGNNTSNGVRVIPVINVPPPYISKGTAKLFGLGSFLHHGKHRPTTTINKWSQLIN